MRIKLLAVIGLVGILVVACKRKPEEAKPAKPMPAKVAPAQPKTMVQAKDLIGNWKTIKGGLGDEIAFEKDGEETVYRSFLQSSPMEVGAWTLAGNTLAIALECRACGITYYQATLEKDLLTLKPADGEIQQYQKIPEQKPAAPADCKAVLQAVRDYKDFSFKFSDLAQALFPYQENPGKPDAEKCWQIQAEISGSDDFGELNAKAGEVGKYLESQGFAVDQASVSETSTGYKKGDLTVYVALRGSNENAEETHQIAVFCK